MSYESDEEDLTKIFNLPVQELPIPSCPGCLESSREINILVHDCAKLTVSYFTALRICPFCNESIVKTGEIEVAVEIPVSATESEQRSVSFRFLESVGHANVSWWRSRLPNSWKGWIELVTVASAIITVVVFLFPSAAGAAWRLLTKSPLELSPIDCGAHFVLKGDKLRLAVRAKGSANGLRFEWKTSAGNLINHQDRNRESEVELVTDAIAATSVPVDVTIGVTAIDEDGGSVFRQERITIIPRRITNNPPVLKIPPRCNCDLQQVIAGKNVSVYALAEDEDSNEELAYDWQSSSPSVQIVKTSSTPGSTAIVTTTGVSPRQIAVPIKISLIVNDKSGGAVTGDITLMILPTQAAETATPVTPPPANHSPKLEAFVADKTMIQAGETITLWAYVTDPDGDAPIYYDWSSSAGDIQNKKETAILNTVGVTSSKIIVVLTISDGRGGKTSQQIPIDVRGISASTASPSPVPQPTAVKDQ